MIPVAGPSITDKEVAYVAEAARGDWYQKAGAFVTRFEQAFAQHTGRRFAIALPSCTAGLHLSLLALGVGPGDEVVVPDATWIASSAPISYVGASPVFADIDPGTWCLDVESVRACITPRTKAIIVVDLYGGMPDMAALQALAEEHGLALIEDAAEAIGSRYDGRPAGAFGATSVFSFHGSKTLTTGEGGMVLTDDETVHARMTTLRDHGRAPGDSNFFNNEIGFKYKMSSLQAALGLAQLERVEELVASKRQIFARYRERLGELSGVTLNAEPAGVLNSYWMSTVVLDPELGITKNELRAALREREIDSRPFFHPLSAIPAYRDTPAAKQAADRNVSAYRVCPYGVNLPSALSLTADDVDLTCDVVTATVTRAAAA